VNVAFGNVADMKVLFDAARPVNGIEEIVTRPDLADRAVFLTLEPIPEERRRPDAELWAAFEIERPPRRRPGRTARGRWQVGCAERQASCARLVSRSPSRRKGGPGPASFISPRSLLLSRERQRMRRSDRPHRPRSFPILILPTASGRLICGRLPMVRTLRAKTRLRPSAPVP
jgi:hypothetical protein